MVDGGVTTSTTIMELSVGTYSITMVATSTSFPSSPTTAQTVEIGNPQIYLTNFFAISQSSFSSRTGVGECEFHNSQLYLPLLECSQWQGSQLGGGVETH